MIYDVLRDLNIKYEEEYHIPVYTVDEANKLSIKIDGVGCKNLFLKDDKSDYYLVFMLDSKRADLKKIAEYIGVKKLRFADEESLKNILNLEKGSVTPLGIINDTDCLVKLIIDKELVGCKCLMHPNRNDRTVSIGFADFMRFIEFTNHTYSLMEM